MKTAIFHPSVTANRWRLRLCSAFFLSACFLPALAQQPEPKRAQDRAPSTLRQQAGQSELEKENLNYVASAPELIKEVLIKDPGLFVELKRLIDLEMEGSVG